MTTIGTFLRFAVESVFRKKSRAFSSIIGVLIAVTLIAGENIAIDTTAKEALDEKLEDVKTDFYGVTSDELSLSDVVNLSEDLEAIRGVERVTPITTLSTTLEIHNTSTLDYAKYGYHEEEVLISVPEGDMIWYNTTLHPISEELHKVSGYVYYMPNGTPVNNISINILEGGSGPGYEVVIYSDESGYYEIELPEANFEVSLFYSWFPINTTWINITRDTTEITRDFHIQIRSFYENSSIEGYLIDHQTNEPIYVSGEVTILDPTILYFKDTFTNVNGYYKMNISSGNFRIYAWADVWNDSTPRYLLNSSLISIPENGSLEYNLTLLDIIKFDGSVYDNLTGEPIESARVTLKSDLDLSATETNYRGYFNFYHYPGSAEVTLSKPGYKILTQNLEFPMASNFHKNFYLDQTNVSKIQGYVLAENGDPPQAPEIIYDQNRFWPDNNGYYSIESTPGDHTINFDANIENEINDHKEFTLQIIGMYPDLTPELGDFIEDRWSLDLVEGDFDLGDMQILIPKWASERYDIGVGDIIHLLDEIRISSSTTNDETIENIVNLTVTGILDDTIFETVTGILEDTIFEEEYINTYFFVNSQDIFTIYDILYNFPEEEEDSFYEDSYPIRTEILLYIDRDEVINPLNREDSTLSLRRLEADINRVSVLNYNVQMLSQMDDAIEEYFAWFEGHRTEMFAYSLPVIVLGLYLGIIGIGISTSQKRREFGILKSRGASENQILLSLIIEAVILGILAGIGGLLFGIIVSKVIIATSPSSGTSLDSLNILQTRISPDSIVLTMIIAMVLMLFASLKPARRISKASLTETLHHYSKPYSEEKYRPNLDIFVVMFSILAYIAIVFISPIIYYIQISGLLFVILILFLIISIYIWFPLSPFLMTFSLTRLLTRGTNKLYRFFSYSLKRFAGEMWYVIEKNIVRNPKRVSNVCIIIALTVSFTVIITTMAATTMFGEEIRIKSEIGGDLSVNSYYTNSSIEHDLNALEGVDDVIAVSWYEAEISTPYWFGNLAVFDASRYDSFLNMESYYFVEGEADEALNLLETGEYAIIGDEVARDNFLEKGDIFRISVRGYGFGPIVNGVSKDFIVAAVVKTLPGLQYSDVLDSSSLWGNEIFCDESAIEGLENIERDWRYLIDVKKGYNSEDVEASILENFSASIYQLGEIRNLEEELDEHRSDFYRNPIVFSMTMNIVFMIIIITVGLGLIMSISTSERKNEIATIMARGASKKQITTLLLGEAISIMLVGIMIGTIVGLVTGYAFNQMLLSLAFTSDIVPGRPFILPPLTFIVIGLCVLSLLIAALLTAIKASKIKLHQELRIRGG